MRSLTACAVLIATAVWTLACSGSVATGPVVHEHHNVERGAATDARVEIDMSAGDLDVKPGAMTLFAGDFDFNVPDLKPASISSTCSTRLSARATRCSRSSGRSGCQPHRAAIVASTIRAIS